MLAVMNRDEFKGKVDNFMGRVKEAVGALTGDKRAQAEGSVERVKGAAEEKVGHVKSRAARSLEEEYDDE